jgi:hypothetical protein
MGMFEQLLGNQAFLAGEALSLAGLHRWWQAVKARESMAKTEPKLG